MGGGAAQGCRGACHGLASLWRDPRLLLCLLTQPCRVQDRAKRKAEDEAAAARRAEARRKAEEERRRIEAEERAKNNPEEAARLAEERRRAEELRRREEELRRQEEEARRKEQEEAEERRRQQAEEAKEEARRKEQAEAAAAAAAAAQAAAAAAVEAKQKAEAAAEAEAEEQARIQAEAEAKRKAEAAEQQKEDDAAAEARRKAEAAAAAAAEAAADAAADAAEEARLAAAAEAARKAAEEAERKAKADAARRAEEARQRAEAEAARRAKVEAARRKAEEDRRRAEEEAAAAAAEAARVAAEEAAKQAAAEERKRKLAERRKRLEELRRKREEKKKQLEEQRRRLEEQRQKEEAEAAAAAASAAAEAKQDSAGGSDPVQAKLERINKEYRATGNKFEDDTFEGRRALAITSEGEHIVSTVEAWERPERFCAAPTVNETGDEYKADDIMQGALGDCWLLSAISVVAGDKTLVNKILVTKKINQAGAYVVQFFIDGEWKKVLVDDRFPCRRRRDGFAPAFVQSRAKNNLWGMLIEKAYAKFYGSYESIEGGVVHIGLAELTGGAAEFVDMEDDEGRAAVQDGSLWKKLLKYRMAGYLMGAGSPAGKDTDISNLGIVQGHAYSILDVAEVDDRNGSHELVCLRNPWGQTEWKGAWADTDTRRWTRRVQAKLGYVRSLLRLWLDG